MRLNQYFLIWRNHVGGKNAMNEWKALSDYLNRKLYDISDQKALVHVLTLQGFKALDVKLGRYNRLNNTDFYLE